MCAEEDLPLEKTFAALRKTEAASSSAGTAATEICRLDGHEPAKASIAKIFVLVKGREVQKSM